MGMETFKAEQDARDKRTAKVVYEEIVAKLSTVDGIATGDAMELGRLIHEYGEKRAGDSAGAIMGPLLDAMFRDKPKKDGEPPREPWQK